jgi:antitoxin component of MazEF toxin-antitoxin module
MSKYTDKAIIRKIGGSKYVVIPFVFAEILGLEIGSEVEFSMDNETLTLKKVK